MGTKTLTITNGAYERLLALKRPKESFSDVVNKLTSKNALLDIVGILSNKEADKLESNIMESRKITESELNKKLGDLR